MADHRFNIKLGLKIIKGDSEKQLNTIKKSLENKKIKLKLDVQSLNKDLKSFEKNLNGINKKLNDAFKLNKDSLQNLKDLKQVLTEINKLSSKTKIKINNSKDVETVTKSLENQKKKYAELIKLKQSLIDQRAKTTDTTAIKSLTDQIKMVEQEAVQCKTKLDKLTEIKLKTDIGKKMTAQFQQVKKEATSLKSQIENTLKNSNTTSSQRKDLEKMLSTIKQINNSRISTKSAQAEPKIQQMRKQLEDFKNKYKKINIEITAKTNLDNAKTKVNAELQKLMSAQSSTRGFNSYLNTSEMDKLIEKTKKLKEDLKNIKMSDNVEVEVQKILAKLDEVKTKYKEVQETAKTSMNAESNTAGLDALKLRIERLRDAEKLTSQQAQELFQKLEAISKLDVGKQANAMKSFKNEISRAVNETERLKSGTQKVNSFFSNLYSTMSSFSLGNIISMQITKAIYGVSDTIRDLDKAFVELNKVAPDSFHGTAEELENVRQKAVEAGQEVARSSTDIINSTASALQLGIDDIDKAIEYAKNVNLYANVGDMSEDESDKFLKSIMSAYGGVESSLDAMSTKVKGAGDNYNRLTEYMDMANYAGNNFALTSKDVGEALSKTSSAFAENGVELNQGIGLIVGAQETVQNASKVGNSFKTMINRLNGVTYSMKEGDIIANKTAQAFEKLAGINIVDWDTGKVKDAYTIFGQLADKWNDMNDIQRNGIADALGGAHHLNTLQALMANWDTVVQYQQEYNDGFMVGSAEKENARFVDSIEGRIIKLKETFNSLVTTTISTDSVKSFLDILTQVLDKVNDIVGAFDDMGMSVPLMVGTFASLGKTIKALGTGSPLSMVGGNLLMSSFSRSGGLVSEFAQKMNEADESAEGFRVRLGSVSGASVIASAKTALLTAGMTLLNTVISGALIAGLTLLCKAVYNYVNANQIAHDKISENIDVTQSNISSLTQQKNSLKDVAEEYDNLSNKTKKTKEESERYNELQKQIADLAPDLVAGTDSDGNPILALNGSLEEYVDNLDVAIERQQQLLKNQQNSLANTSIGDLKKYRNNESSLKGTISEIGSYSSAWDDTNDSPWNKAGLKNAQDGANKYVQIIKDRNSKVTKLNTDLTESFEKFSSIEAEQQQKVYNKLGDEYIYKNYNKLKKERKNAMDTLISNFNWGSSVVDTEVGQQKFIKNFDTLSEKIGKNTDKVKEWNKTLSQADYAFQETGDYEQFAKDISGVTKEIAELTGTKAEDWVTGFTNQLRGALDPDSIGVNNFLKSFNKTFSDLQNGDKVAIKIQAEYDDTSQFLQDLSSAGTRQEMVDFMVRVNTGEVNYGNLPYQIQEMLKGTLDGGKTMGDWEASVVMKVATEIQDNGELDDKTFGLITKMLNGELSETQIKAGIELPSGQVLSEEVVRTINDANKSKDNNVKVGVELAKDKLNDDLETLLGGKENKQLRLDLVTNFEDKKFQTFNDLIADMDTEKQIDIATAFVNYGDLTPEEMEKFIKSLPEEVQTVIKTIYDNSGIEDAENSLYNVPKVQTIILKAESKEAKESIENLIDTLDGMDGLDKDVKVNIIDNITKDGGTTDGIMKALDSIKDLPTEKKLQIISNIQDVMANIEGLDKEKISTKIAKVLGDTSDADSKINATNEKQVEKKTAKVEGDTTDANNKINTLERKDVSEKYFGIHADDYATVKLTNVDDYQIQDKHFSIWVALKEKVKGALNVLNRAVENGQVNSISEFSNIGDNPEEVDNSVSTGGISTFSAMSNDSSMNTTSISGGSSTDSIRAFASKALRPFTEIGKTTTIGTKIDIKKETLDAIEYSVNLMQELEYRIDNVNDKLALLDVKMENAVGTEKIKYLQKQNALYEEQAKLQKELYDNLTEEKQIVKDKLKGYGFTFDAQGNLRSYDEILIKMEKKAKELEDKAEKASKKASDYETKSSSIDSDKYDTSDKKLTKKQKKAIQNAKKQAQKQAKAESEASKQTKKALEKKADKAKDESDKYKEKLEKVKDLTSEYLKIQRDEIPDAEKEWLEMQNSIKKNNDEIEKLELEDKLYKFKNSVTGLTNQYDIWSDKIDLIDTKLNNSLQTDKVTLYQQKLSALNKQLEIQEKTLESLRAQLPVYQEALSKYGVNFGEKGNIINMSNVLDKYQNSEDLEKINDLMEEYNDLIRDTIPNAEKEYEDLNNAIQDVYESQLDVVKDVEDKITNVIKDQIDKRKELIQKQYDKEIELLNKRKKEYNDNKSTNDYYKNLEEAQDEIDKIQAKINKLSFDNSLASRGKISDLMDDLKEAQDKYNDLVSDRSDDLINNMYDDEIDRLQKESDDKIQELEDKWTDSKIAELVAQSLGSGIFTDIDGEVHNLQDTLIDFAEESGDALGVLGDKIKTELVLNLQEALDYIKDYSDIFDSMGLKQLGNVNYTDKIGGKSLKVDDIEINVYGTDNMDEQELAKLVAKQLDNKFSEITNGGLL